MRSGIKITAEIFERIGADDAHSGILYRKKNMGAKITRDNVNLFESFISKVSKLKVKKSRKMFLRVPFVYGKNCYGCKKAKNGAV